MTGISMHNRRHLIAAQDGWVCRYCGVEVRCSTCLPGSPVVATLDHVIPLSRGGTSALQNLVLACAGCNSKKGDQTWPVDVSRKRPKPRRQQPRHLTQPIQPERTRCRRSGGGGIRKAWDSKALADAMCLAVYRQHGVELVPYQCTKCSWWHVNKSEQVTALRRRGAAMNGETA